MVGAVVVMLGALVLSGAAQDRKYCGKALTDTVSLVCDGIFNMFKRENTHTYDIDSGVEDVEGISDESQSLSDVFKERRNAISMVRKRHLRQPQQRTVGIVDECCYKACNIQELQTYCAN